MLMRKTRVEALLQLVDVTASGDSSPDASGNIGDISKIKQNVKQRDLALAELNTFILDGSKAMAEDDEPIVFISGLSDDDCTFSTIPTIEIAFTQNHTSAGISFHFVGDYPREIKVSWFTLDGMKINSMVFNPDRLDYSARKQIENYGKIKIEFLSTRFPSEAVKMDSIMYGINVVFDSTNIKSAKLVEEIDVTSATLSINTLNIDILDENDDYNIANNDGLWKSLQKTQGLKATEYIDDEPVELGTFFLDENSYSGNIASLSFIDSIGTMDSYMFCDGQIYENVLAGVILEQIFASANITEYEIDDEVYFTQLSGTLEVQTCREALQMVCFACGAVADDSRNGAIRTHKPSRQVRYNIGVGRKFNQKASVELGEYISGVSVACKNYTLNDESETIFEGILAQGTHRIELTTPCKVGTLSIVGGTIINASTYYIEVSVPSNGSVTITGKTYSDSEVVFTKSVDRIEAGEHSNVKEFTGITLYDSETMDSNLQYLLDFYALRKNLSMEYIADAEQVGAWVNVADRSGNMSTTLITSQSIDLAGGFISTASCVGYSVVVTNFAFAGNELYTGSEVLF